MEIILLKYGEKLKFVVMNFKTWNIYPWLSGNKMYRLSLIETGCSEFACKIGSFHTRTIVCENKNFIKRENLTSTSKNLIFTMTDIMLRRYIKLLLIVYGQTVAFKVKNKRFKNISLKIGVEKLHPFTFLNFLRDNNNFVVMPYDVSIIG